MCSMRVISDTKLIYGLGKMISDGTGYHVGPNDYSNITVY